MKFPKLSGFVILIIVGAMLGVVSSYIAIKFIYSDRNTDYPVSESTTEPGIDLPQSKPDLLPAVSTEILNHQITYTRRNAIVEAAEKEGAEQARLEGGVQRTNPVVCTDGPQLCCRTAVSRTLIIRIRKERFGCKRRRAPPPRPWISSLW